MIGSMKEGQFYLKDQPLTGLIQDGDFLRTLWLAWTGEELRSDMRELISACLVACVDHGEAPPSAQVTRIVASAGKSLADAVAGGILTFGPRHGNAGSAAARFLIECQAVSESEIAPFLESYLKTNKRIPGFGHPEYEVDPRTQVLFEISKRVLSKTPFIDRANRVSTELSRIKQKPLPVNVDGALGAIMAELGLDPELADALFLLSRTVGLIAHAREEASVSTSYRRA